VSASGVFVAKLERCLTIPVAEKAKPRRIEISHDGERTAVNA
jgi:hypothetical protein